MSTIIHVFIIVIIVALALLIAFIFIVAVILDAGFKAREDPEILKKWQEKDKENEEKKKEVGEE